MYAGEYHKARLLGQKEAKLCQAKGGAPHLPVLEEILAVEVTCGEVSLGLVDVPLELVVGTRTAGRSRCFSRGFLPLMEEDSEFADKWMALCRAHMEEGIQDPIKVYEYMHTFYVVEGHKRVSVLRYFGAVSIPAYVTRILPARNDSLGSRIYYEYADFYQLSGVNYLWFSGAGRFARLQAAVGKGPEETWSEEDRQDFFSFYTHFSALYGDKSAKELAGRLTTADAMLLFLDTFGYDQVKNCTPAELKPKFSQLREAFSVKEALQNLVPLKGLWGR
ncbi:hypothetical protein D1159_14525 [Pseudoflavonifractor sp. 524-17]|uniref:hypothetical protein n=1 Tax=Pseudoflavonifractor sp. 524-17 TaxID=2304577 RepID=UPI00137957CF|nr:hypothetical protein [Pseudoflavonifractor sp. 524-17]NCE65756.1 hypothetical protein [Pseudoflavonifractor sp. 524-17]